MNAALHIKTLIWFGNCQPQKERNKGKSACNNRGSGKAAASSQRVLSTIWQEPCEKRHPAALLLSDRRKLLRKMGFTSAAQNLGTTAGEGASEEPRFVSPSPGSSARGAEPGFASTARPHAYNTPAMFRLKLQDSL